MRAPTFRILQAPKGCTALDAVRHAYDAAWRLPWERYDVVWFERPAGRFVKSIADLSRVYGAVLAAIPECVPVSEMPPAQWKATVGLKGNAGKPDVIAWAAARWPSVEWDEHMADAYAVAVACLVESNRALEAS